MTSVQYTCGTTTLTGTDVMEEYTSGPGLQNLGIGYYQWNWSTPKTIYANQCRKLTLMLSGGAGYVLSPAKIEANSKFTK